MHSDRSSLRHSATGRSARRRLAMAAVAAALIVPAACADTEDTEPPVTDLPSLASVPSSEPATDSTDTGTGTDSTDVDDTDAPTGPSTSGPTTDAPDTDVPPAPAQSFAVPGPYLAGVTTLDLGDRQAEVWYPVDPADVEGASSEIFDTLTVFPENLQALIPPELSGLVDTKSFRDVPVSLDAPFPVVVYSHGFGGYRQVATAYTSHLASWGFVVVSVDHLERGIAAQATSTLVNVPGQDVRDVRNALDALGSGRLAASVDLNRVAITGHSAGAGTSARAALDLDRIDGFISISGGAPLQSSGDIGASVQLRGTASSATVTVEAVTDVDVTLSIDGAEPVVVPFDGTSATIGDIVVQVIDGETLRPGTVTVERAAADKPALVVIAELDQVVLPASSNALFRLLDSPRYRVEIGDAGHNSFTDSCAGIRELGGLDSLADLIGEAQVARAEDGCTPQYVDPAVATAVLGHYSVAFLRTLFGIADDTATLTTDISGAPLEGVLTSDGQPAEPVSLTTFDAEP